MRITEGSRHQHRSSILFLSVADSAHQHWRPHVQALIPDGDDTVEANVFAVMEMADAWARHHGVARSCAQRAILPKTVKACTEEYMADVHRGHPTIPGFLRRYCAERLGIMTRERKQIEIAMRRGDLSQEQANRLLNRPLALAG